MLTICATRMRSIAAGRSDVGVELCTLCQVVCVPDSAKLNGIFMAAKESKYFSWLAPTHTRECFQSRRKYSNVFGVSYSTWRSFVGGEKD